MHLESSSVNRRDPQSVLLGWIQSGVQITPVLLAVCPAIDLKTTINPLEWAESPWCYSGILGQHGFHQLGDGGFWGFPFGDDWKFDWGRGGGTLGVSARAANTPCNSMGSKEVVDWYPVFSRWVLASSYVWNWTLRQMKEEMFYLIVELYPWVVRVSIWWLYPFCPPWHRRQEQLPCLDLWVGRLPPFF